MTVETMIRLKPVADRTPVTVHFLSSGQSLGFSSSVGRAKVTKKESSGVLVDAPLVPFSLSIALAISAMEHPADSGESKVIYNSQQLF